MATVNKDFKIKHGLIVEGQTGTINGEDILTKAADDQTYIIGLIGGSSDSANTPNTVVKRDGSGNFAAGEITADLVGDVTGTVSDLSNHYTDGLQEGLVNKYFTEDRVKDVLTGSTQTNISITNVGGVLHIEAENGVDDSTTDDLDEGTTNKYFTDARARLALSEGNGINYNNITGEISADLGDFDTDDLSEGSSNKYFTDTRARNAVSAGNGLDYDSLTGTFSADLGSGLTIAAGEIAVDRTTTDTWYDASGSASTVQGNLQTHETATTGIHGVSGNIVGTSDTQTLTNKTFNDTVYFDASGITSGRIIPSPTDVTVQGTNGLVLKSVFGDVVLEAPAGANAYVGSVSAGNIIATNSYVDNAISGLNWKPAVNLLADVNVSLTGFTNPMPFEIDGHTVSDGYRVLLKGQSIDADNGIYEVSITGGSYTLSRPADSDAFSELVGAAVFVMEGTQYGSTSWVQSDHYLSSFAGQDWTQFSGQGSVTAGTGITVDGLEVSIDRTTVDTWYDAAGTASSEVGTHAGLTSTHGVNGDIVGTTDSQTLTNKTLDFGMTGLNSASNIPNSALTNDSITVNGYATALGSSVTLNTDDVSEGSSNKYFSDNLARLALSGGTAINYDNATGIIAVDATQLDTGDIAEGTNLYYTDGRVKDVLTGATKTNISITNVAGELIITAENGVADSTTDDLDEGVNNHYFTDTRAKDAAANLLTSATKSNITITGTGAGLTITAENGVADSTTDDLDEGVNNLYFTDQRAVSALEAVVPNFTAVEIDSIAKQIAATISAPTGGSQVTAYSFAKADYRSAKFLVKCAYSTHTELTEVLITLDSSDNIAIVEYATVGTNGSSMAVTADVDGSNVRLRVTPTNNNSTVTVVGTLLA